MKCPVCGYENGSDDAVCIACGSEMALAAESIAIEKRRSQEAMERYHQQQKELRREFGVDKPEEESLVMAGSGDNVSSDGQAGPWEASLELEEIPADFHSKEMLCPQCGFRNALGSIECIRCGVIFSKLKAPRGNVTGPGGTPAVQNGDIAMDPATYGLDTKLPEPEAPEQKRREVILDDPGASFVDTAAEYSPYVHEIKAEPWSGAKATGRWVKNTWEGADFAGKGETALKGGRKLGLWLKQINPKWYGVALAVVCVLALLPLAWQGAAHLKSGWDQRVQGKREAKLVEAFTQNSDAIRAEVRSLADAEKFEEARVVLARFDIPPLKGEVKPLGRYLEEKETYARVLTVPAWKYETNYTLFTRLVELNPTNELYRTKQAYYMERLAENCYGKALSHYKSRKNNAAESEKAVALIEKAVGFYPKNQSYKELRSKLISADLLFYKGNGNLQMALRDEGRGTASYARQRKITVWLRNSSEDTLYINPDFFTLETSNGKHLKYNNMMETGFKGKLAAGEKTAGTLYFRTLAMPRQLTFEHLVAGTVQREFP